MPNSRLTVIGQGSDGEWMHRLARELNIDRAIDWIDWMPQQEVMQTYAQYDAFLFPSLHDSSGNVVLEALAHSLPVVCLNLGGPGAIVDSFCGRAIDTTDARPEVVVQKISAALRELASDRDLLQQLQQGAYNRSQTYHWHQLVRDFYATLEAPTKVTATAE